MTLLSSAGNVPASALKASSDVLTSDAENLGQSPISDPAFVKVSRAFDIERRFDMRTVMRGLVHDFEVVEPVVSFITVDVVNMLGSEQVAPKVLRHDPTVFIDLPAVPADDPIAGSIQSVRPLPVGVTGMTTERLLLIGTDGALLLDEVFTARRTGEGDVHAQ